MKEKPYIIRGKIKEIEMSAEHRKKIKELFDLYDQSRKYIYDRVGIPATKKNDETHSKTK